MLSATQPVLWMDEILRHFETMGNHCLSRTKKGIEPVQNSLGGANWILQPSTVWLRTELNGLADMNPGILMSSPGPLLKQTHHICAATCFEERAILGLTILQGLERKTHPITVPFF